MSKFHLEQRVKVNIPGGVYHGQKATVSGIFTRNKYGWADYDLRVKTDSGTGVDLKAEQVTTIDVQHLRAYKDGSDEVHWATRDYSDAEVVALKYVRVPNLDRKVELE